MSSLDVEYFRGRAAAERKLAHKSDRLNVAAIHEELARHYEAVVEREVAMPNPWTSSKDSRR